MTGVTQRRARLSWCALLLALLFGLASTRAASAFTPTCTRCPVNCPMHAHKLGCHTGNTTGMGNGAGCHHQRVGGTSLSCAGCQHHFEGVVATDQPAVPVVGSTVVVVPASKFHCIGSLPPATHVFLDPPFRPPATSAVVL